MRCSKPLRRCRQRPTGEPAHSLLLGSNGHPNAHSVWGSQGTVRTSTTKGQPLHVHAVSGEDMKRAAIRHPSPPTRILAELSQDNWAPPLSSSNEKSFPPWGSVWGKTGAWTFTLTWHEQSDALFPCLSSVIIDLLPAKTHLNKAWSFLT